MQPVVVELNSSKRTLPILRDTDGNSKLGSRRSVSNKAGCDRLRRGGDGSIRVGRMALIKGRRGRRWCRAEDAVYKGRKGEAQVWRETERARRLHEVSSDAITCR